MFDGYLSLAGTEVVNVSRLHTYARAELPGLIKDCDCDCELLHEALGDRPYSTPVNDQAPWVDADNPDTWGFFGMLPLSVSGIQNSTAEYAITRGYGDHGYIGRRRLAPLEFRVRGLLVARDAAGMEAGYSWLKALANGACSSGCGGGSQFCYLSHCPTDLTEVGGVQRTEVEMLTGREWLSTPRFNPPLPCGEIRWVFTISAAESTPATIRVRQSSGEIFSYEVEVHARQTYIASDMGQATGSVWVEIEGDVAVHTAVLEARTAPMEQSCADELIRQLRDVVVTSGPAIIRDYAPTQGALREVEMTFTAAPWTYGSQILVASVHRGTVTAMPGANITALDKTLPMCEEEPLSWRDVMVDPNCSIDPPPPLPRTGSTACRPVTGYAFTYQVDIPASVIPDWSVVVPSLRIKAAGSPVRGVRVRFLPNPLGLPASELEPCSECSSFSISFIPRNGAFVVDGTTERAYVDYQGTTFSASHYLDAARPGTSYSWPELTCGVPYVALIEIAANNEVETIDFWLTPRE